MALKLLQSIKLTCRMHFYKKLILLRRIFNRCSVAGSWAGREMLTMVVGEHGSKRGNDDKLWTVEMVTVEEEEAFKAYRHLYGRFEDCEVDKEPETFYNRVLDIICDGDEPEAVTEVGYGPRGVQEFVMNT